MKNKGALLFGVDVLILTLFSALIATGSILRWVLPPGSGGHGRGWRSESAATVLDLTRHEWGDVHFWIAAVMVGGILLHLLLHFGWLKASLARYLSLSALRRHRSPAQRA